MKNLENVKTIGPVDRKSSVVDFYSTNRTESIKEALENVSLKGHFAEFGVANGITARQIVGSVPKGKKFYLFDSFEGIPEDWTERIKKGAYAQTELPVFEEKCVVIKQGLFDDVLPDFVKRVTSKFAFIHIDCDLYSSTISALTNFEQNIGPGTVILFDEIIGIEEAIDHEMKAFDEFIELTGLDYDVIFKSNYSQVCIKIK